MKKGIPFYVINGITWYRVIAAPFLLMLLYLHQFNLFKWLLLASFFTDFIDGFLARTFKVTSVAGTRLDSIGDDLTVLVALIGLFVLHIDFIKEQKWVLIFLLVLFLLQAGFAIYRYGKTTSFHTYVAKLAAFAQGVFLLLVYFSGAPNPVLFYLAAGITGLELLEEIILVRLLPAWQTNVKGIYWALQANGRQKKERQNRVHNADA